MHILPGSLTHPEGSLVLGMVVPKVRWFPFRRSWPICSPNKVENDHWLRTNCKIFISRIDLVHSAERGRDGFPSQLSHLDPSAVRLHCQLQCSPRRVKAPSHLIVENGTMRGSCVQFFHPRRGGRSRELLHLGKRALSTTSTPQAHSTRMVFITCTFTTC